MITTGGIDAGRALDWVADLCGPIGKVRELTGGFTSTMLALTTADANEVVLRLMTEEPWRSHGAALTRRERDVQEMLASTPLPVPRSRALDEHGEATGHPAHLMTRVPGSLQSGRVEPEALRRLAETLGGLHRVRPTIAVRDYQSWAWPAKHVVPGWAVDPGVWRAAFTLLGETPPSYEACLIHRDFHLRNVLWEGARISGVVDWVETSIGPAWLDVAHCRTHLALDHGEVAAGRFVRAYVEATDVTAQPYFEVMDAVGCLPPPGRQGLVSSDTGRRRLETRVRRALDDVGRWGP